MEYELYHYGVKGMKWGVRRYQNKDGSLTPAGKKRARQEVRSDNKTAYELGKEATITGHATAKSMKRTIKLENKLDKQFDKDPYGATNRTKRLHGKWEDSAKTTAQLAEKYVANRDKAEKHCKELIDKYGDEAVSSIKYKDVKLPSGEYSPSSFRTMNERTNNVSDYAKAGAATVGTTAMLTLMGAPFAMLYYPAGTKQKAAQVESTTYYQKRQARRNGG